MCVKRKSHWRCDSILFFVLAVCMIASTIALIALPVERQELVLRKELDGHRLRQLEERLDARERVACRGTSRTDCFVRPSTWSEMSASCHLSAANIASVVSVAMVWSV